MVKDMSRMDRYNNVPENNEPTLSRVTKNNSLYNDMKNSDLSRAKESTNIRVLESNGKTINIEKIKKYLEDNKTSNNHRRTAIITDEELEKLKQNNEQTEEKKVYDINSVLAKAKQNREIDYEEERYKKLRDTQYDILSKINIYNEAKEEDENEDLNTEEQTLVNLINTITIHKNGEDLLGELTLGSEEEKTLPIEEEKEKNTFTNEIKESIENAPELKVEKLEIDKTKELTELKDKTTQIDNSFFTNSFAFSKEDFEGFEDLEKSVKKNSVLTRIMLGLLIVFIVITIIIIMNYVFKIGLF